MNRGRALCLTCECAGRCGKWQPIAKRRRRQRTSNFPMPISIWGSFWIWLILLRMPSMPGRSSLPRRLPLASIEIPKGCLAARLTSLRRTPARPTRTPKGRFAARLIPTRRKLRQPLGQPRERSVERQLLHGKLLIPPSSSLRWDCIPGGFPRTKAVLQKNCVHSIALCPKRATWVKLAWTSRSAE